MLTKKVKENIINKHKKSDTDTGSSHVQVAMLTRQISELASHLRKNKKDNHSRRGLIKMVAKRRTHLLYLKKNEPKSYAKLTKELDLKK